MVMQKGWHNALVTGVNGSSWQPGGCAEWWVTKDGCVHPGGGASGSGCLGVWLSGTRWSSVTGCRGRGNCGHLNLLWATLGGTFWAVGGKFELACITHSTWSVANLHTPLFINILQSLKKSELAQKYTQLFYKILQKPLYCIFLRGFA